MPTKTVSIANTKLAKIRKRRFEAILKKRIIEVFTIEFVLE